MRKHIIKLITAGIVPAVLLLAVSCKKNSPVNNGATAPTTTTTPTKPTTPVTYTLVWSDEFNGNSVDPTNWNFETGYLNVNNEKEYYKAENAAVANGNLMITAKAEA